ncbi:hypothetical protein PSPO01_12761 [Paraphaeosphaeria sporulosa]
MERTVYTSFGALDHVFEARIVGAVGSVQAAFLCQARESQSALRAIVHGKFHALDSNGVNVPCLLTIIQIQSVGSSEASAMRAGFSAMSKLHVHLDNALSLPGPDA